MIQRCVDAVVRWCRCTAALHWPKAREGLAHYGTAVLALNWMTALHERWLWRSQHAGEVVSGYGAGLVMLGVFVGARPYLRAGISRMVEGGLPPYRGAFLRGIGAAEQHRQYVATLRPGVRLDVWAERVIAVFAVLVGTFLNGYGAPLARRWGLLV